MNETSPRPQGASTGLDATIIDTTFNFVRDAGGKDPDSHSPTLRRYHQLLWSKPLPDGRQFDLVTTTPRVYLHHRESDLGEFWLSSDAVMATFSRRWSMAPIIEQIPADDMDSFRTLGYTIGAMMVFPGNQIGGKWTINQARGCNGSIADRFDLTVECIRRHYTGEPSPLTEVLHRYSNFFALFGDFDGYVEFFLIEDMFLGRSPVTTATAITSL